MSSRTPEMLLGEAGRLGIECGDCGRTRWLKPRQLVGRDGITLHTSLSAIGRRLSCSACTEEGLPGKNVSLQVWFDKDVDRDRIEAAVLRSQIAPSAGSRAKSF